MGSLQPWHFPRSRVCCLIPPPRVVRLHLIVLVEENFLLIIVRTILIVYQKLNSLSLMGQT